MVNGLRGRHLTQAGAIAAILGYVVSSWWYRRQGMLPGPSVIVALFLALLAAALWLAAARIRASRRPDGRALDPLRVFRTLVLAQAGALTGASVVGWFLGVAAVLAPDADAGSVREDALRCGLAALTGVLLVVSGLRVQSACRVDPPPDDDDSAEGKGTV